MNTANSRRGMALMVTLITLAIVSLLITAIAWQLFANRQLLKHREHVLQAEWLARTGIEHAAARLLGDAADYRGETIEPLPASSVRIEVTPSPESPGSFEITSEARYPTDAAPAVARSATRTFQLETDGKAIRLVAVSNVGE